MLPKIISVLTALSLTGLTLRAQAPNLRSWTDTQGRKIDAAILTATDTTVTLKLPTGKTIDYPLAKLNEADRAFVADWLIFTPQTTPPSKDPETPAPPNKSPEPPAPPPQNPAWPTTIALEELPEVKEITDQPGKFIYQSPSYEFECDARLNPSVVREFSRLFEATRLVATQLPLSFNPKPEPGRTLFACKLYAEKDDYIRAGGLPGSAGIYSRSQQAMMIPLESLGVRKVGKGYSLDHDQENTTVIHEVTHQMMNYWLHQLPVWYIEGSAEYVAAAPYRKGRFTFTRMGAAIHAYLKKEKGVWEGTLDMMPLTKLLAIEPEEWAEALTSEDHLASKNYASAAILAHYFHHEDDKGDAAHLIAWLQALKHGAPLQEATQTHLLRGRTHQNIEKEITKTMRREGLKITFPPVPDTKSTTPATED